MKLWVLTALPVVLFFWKKQWSKLDINDAEPIFAYFLELYFFLKNQKDVTRKFGANNLMTWPKVAQLLSEKNIMYCEKYTKYTYCDISSGSDLHKKTSWVKPQEQFMKGYGCCSFCGIPLRDPLIASLGSNLPATPGNSSQNSLRWSF